MNARARTALTTLGLIAAMVGIFTYAYYGVEKKEEAEAAKKATEEKLYAFDRIRVKQVVVEVNAGKTRIERATEGDGWRIVEPVQAEADKTAVDQVIDKVAGLIRKSEVAGSNEGQAEQYGLAKPVVQVTLTLDDGRTETLALGETNAFDGSVYARPTDGRVVLVGGDARFPVEKKTFDLREKRLMIFEDKEVTKVEVTGVKKYGFIRDGEKWKLTAPLQDQAESQTVDKVLMALRGLRATAFLPEGKKEHGLDKPRWTVTLTLRDGLKHTLALGEPAAKGKADAAKLYARRVEGGEVAEIPPTIAKELDLSTLDLRDKTVVAFDREKVAAVKFDGASGPIEVKKSSQKSDAGATEEGWAIAAPQSAPAKRWKMSGLLYGLSSLKATAFADESGKKVAEHGLDKPTQTVTFLDGEGKELARLEVGKEKGEKVFVRSTTSPKIFEVEKSRLSEMPKNLDDLLDKGDGEEHAKTATPGTPG
jgi:hypothetical protein